MAIESDEDDDSYPGPLCCSFKIQMWSQTFGHDPASVLGGALHGVPPSTRLILGMPPSQNLISLKGHRVSNASFCG